jgi:hypothetical protein
LNEPISAYLENSPLCVRMVGMKENGEGGKEEKRNEEWRKKRGGR